MTEHRFTDAAAIAGTRRTQDGYLVAEVRCARTGCQEYLGAELGFADRDRIVVYRPEAAVFAKESLATFAHKPVTLGHPAQDVSPDTWKSVAVGDVGEEIARDGEFVRVSLKLMDAAAIKAVEDGVRELSMGYRTPIVLGDGAAPDGTRYQATMTGPITINHLALVPRARGGSQLRIGDDASAWGASPTFVSDQKEDPMSDTLKTVVLGDKAVQIAAADASVLDAYKAAQDKRLADAQADHEKAIAAKDAALAKAEADRDAAKAKVLSDADLDARVAARAALIDTAKRIAPEVKAQGLSDAALRKAVVVAKLGDAVSGKSDAYIDARFDILAEDAAKADPVADAMRASDGKVVTLDGAYAERDAALRDAWMQPARKEA